MNTHEQTRTYARRWRARTPHTPSTYTHVHERTCTHARTHSVLALARTHTRTHAPVRSSKPRFAIREPPPPPLLPPLPVGASPLCGRMRSPSHAISTVGLFVLTYRTPRSLEWSMRSWEQNGLLERMAQKMLLANDPQQIELLLGKAFGFEARTRMR
eukprot:6201159-Pleurochrysis_carterae.AAC.1